MSKKLLLSIFEAGEELCISRAFVYKLIAANQLRSIKIGRSSRIPYAELERYVAELAKRQHDDPTLAIRLEKLEVPSK